MNTTQPPRIGNRDAWMATHSCFRCAGQETDQDEWVTIVCGTDEEWQALSRPLARGQSRLPTEAAPRKSEERKLRNRLV